MTEGTPVKVGILGAGYISEFHARALRFNPGCRLIAVADRDIGRANTLAAQCPGATAVGGLDALLAQDIDAVHVLLPAERHAEAAEDVLRAGKHLYLEKPMAVSADESSRIVSAASDSEARIGVGYNFLFLPAYERMHGLITQGKAGQIKHVTINWSLPLGSLWGGPYTGWMLRNSRNTFIDIGTHAVAYALHLAGDARVATVHVSEPIDLPTGATIYRRWAIDLESSGPTIRINLSMNRGLARRTIDVDATGMSLHCDFGSDISYGLTPYTGNVLFENAATMMRTGLPIFARTCSNQFRSIAGTLRKSPDKNPYELGIRRAIDAFYSTLSSQPDERLTGEFGLRVARLCDEITTLVLAENPEPLPALTSPAPPTVLVTGGTGFIGRYLVRKLVETGRLVRVVTRSEAASRITLKGLPVEITAGSLADADFRAGALQGIDTVYHLARSTTADTFEGYYRDDVMVTKALAEDCLKAGIKAFIYTGTIRLLLCRRCRRNDRRNDPPRPEN